MSRASRLSIHANATKKMEQMFYVQNCINNILGLRQSWREKAIYTDYKESRIPNVKHFTYYYYILGLQFCSNFSRYLMRHECHVRRSESRMLLEPPFIFQNKRRWFMWCRHVDWQCRLANSFSIKSRLQNWVGRWVLKFFLCLWRPGLGSSWRLHVNWAGWSRENSV